MLNGSRAPGSSSAPVSGKIGRRAGSSAKAPSGEEDRGEPLARSDAQRIAEADRREEFEQLLARRLVVPGAVAPDAVEQMVDGLFALAGGEERRSQIEPRLMVLGIGRQPHLERRGLARRLSAALAKQDIAQAKALLARVPAEHANHADIVAARASSAFA